MIITTAKAITTSIEFRRKLSEEAFAETAYYDSIVTNYFTSITKNTFVTSVSTTNTSVICTVVHKYETSVFWV